MTTLATAVRVGPVDHQQTPPSGVHRSYWQLLTTAVPAHQCRTHTNAARRNYHNPASVRARSDVHRAMTIVWPNLFTHIIYRPPDSTNRTKRIYASGEEHFGKL